MELQKRLKQLRMDREMTLEQLAAECRVNKATIWNIETGKVTKPHDLTLHKIRKAFPELFDEAA